MANLEDRVRALEQQLAQLNDRLSMEAGLAAGRDRDLSDLTVTVRSHTAMLQAVQERQAEHTEQLGAVVDKLAEHDRRFDEVALGQQTIIAMLTTLIGQGEPGEGA